MIGDKPSKMPRWQAVTAESVSAAGGQKEGSGAKASTGGGSGAPASPGNGVPFPSRVSKFSGSQAENSVGSVSMVGSASALPKRADVARANSGPMPAVPSPSGSVPTSPYPPRRRSTGRPARRETGEKRLAAVPNVEVPDTGSIARRSIQERFATQQADPTLLAAAETSFIADDPGTSTFRIDATGELVMDEAISLAHSANNNKLLGQLDSKVAQAHHLLALPEDMGADEIEDLAVSVWNEAGWINPGVLHLSEGVTLEGPWQLNPLTKQRFRLPESVDRVWRLQSEVMRGAPPLPHLVKIDPWAGAFPEGMPVGVEYKALLVLKRMARRLGGALRIAGSGVVMADEVESAVNLRVFSPEYLPQAELQAALESVFPGLQPAGPLVTEDGAPYAFSFPAARSSQIMVGVRSVDRLPRALRLEEWVRQSIYLYEVTWANAAQFFMGGQLSRSGRLERSAARQTIGVAAAAVADQLRFSAIVDEDDFKLDPAVLVPMVEGSELNQLGQSGPIMLPQI